MTDSRLTRALRPQAGDFEHPVHEVLVAFVDGLADAADVEWIDAHLDVCAICREDVGDLREVQRQLLPAPVPLPAPGRRDVRQYAVYAAIAAGVALVAWLGGAFDSAKPEPGSVLVATNPSAPLTAPQAPTEQPDPVAAPPSRLSPPDQQMVTRALEAGRPTWPAFHDIVRSRAGTLLGDTPALPPLAPTSPTATAVTTTRPEFTWTAASGATSYEISIYDDSFRQVATSGPLSRTGWRPDRDLPRGQILTWQITAVTPAGTTVSPAPPQPEARFVVLSEPAVAAVNAARARLADEPLALGIALAEAGLYREAEAALTRATVDPRYDAAQVRRVLAALRR